jgi:hypothetical protein
MLSGGSEKIIQGTVYICVKHFRVELRKNCTTISGCVFVNKQRNWKVEKKRGLKIYQQKETVETAAIAASVKESMWRDISRDTRIKRYCSVHIITIILIPLMQGIYNYVSETIHAFRVYSVAAVLYLQSVPHVMLFIRYTVYQLFSIYALCHM